MDNRSASAISFTKPANDVRLTANYVETDMVDSTYLVVDLETGLIHYTDGSWNSLDVQYCRSANRSYSYPSYSSGFHVVWPP